MIALEVKIMKNYSEFTKQYQIQKTLRFSLIPQKETLAHIQKDGILTSDMNRKRNYMALKSLIDNVHKKFIDKTLDQVNINWEPLGEAIQNLHKDKTDKHRETVKDCQSIARAHIVRWFEGKEGTKDFQDRQKQYYKKLFGKELFSEILVDNKQGLSADELEIVKSFDKFTTYFTGFYENRKNMYSAEEKSTAVAFRIVNDNFSKFLNNCMIYQSIQKILFQQYPHILNKLESACSHISGGTITLEDLFTIPYYNHLMTQHGIELFNQIIGGVAVKVGDQKVQGLNEIINIAMQQEDELKNLFKSKPHRFEPLYKQILSDRAELPFLQEIYQNDEEALEAVRQYFDYLQNRGTLDKVMGLFEHMASNDSAKIYVVNSELQSFSLLFTGQWNLVHDTLINIKSKELGDHIKDRQKAKIEQWVKQTDFSLKDLMSYMKDTDTKDGNKVSLEVLVDEIRVIVEKAKQYIDSPIPEEMRTLEEKTIVKNGLDSIQQIYHVLKFFDVPSEYDRDLGFYNLFDDVYADTKNIIDLYNKVRNVATKKPYSEEKYKLNFYNPELAGGWDKNKEKEYGSILLLKDGKYFLGIFNPYAKPNLEKAVTRNTEKVYQKMVYKFFPSISKMLPKCTTQLRDVKAHFSQSVDAYTLESDRFIEPLTISKEIYDLNNVTDDHDKKKFQIDYLRNTEDAQGYYTALHAWINFAKEFVSKYKSTCIYDFSHLRKTEEYTQLDEFYKDLDNTCYQITYENIPEETIWEWVKNDRLYLFEIYNKDFSNKSTGRPNMHTLYWKSVFDPQNLSDVVIKLNGQAELFYRPKSNMPIVKHNLGGKLVNRKGKNGKPIADDVYKEIYLYANGKRNKQELSSRALGELSNVTIKDVSHIIIKDRRYTDDAFFFHVPLTLNYQAPAKPKQFNKKVQDFLRNNEDVNIIGIDRGERNLIYAVVIDQKGRILESKPFNIISQFDYHSKLEQRQEERLQARKSWDTVNKIKNLKEGYLSLVIHEIAQMMVKYHAIVVLENLNAGFKRMRTGIAEKSVYQKFEKMLIDKLNYLAFKDFAVKDSGGILNAYQLTDKFDSFKAMGSQCGFLFYVPAAYTSKIDPTTGFVNMFNLYAIKNRKEQKKFISQFDSLKYAAHRTGEFILHCDLTNGFKVLLESYRKEWDIHITGERIVYDRKNKKHERIDLVKQLSQVLDAFGVNYQSGEDILPAILSIEDDLSHAKLFSGIFYIIKCALQMRNSDNNEDYIVSPIMNDQNQFFDSRNADDSMPKDGDANGAYHIALKGLYMLRKINTTPIDKNVSLAISNKDWLEFMQNKRYEK